MPIRTSNKQQTMNNKIWFGIDEYFYFTTELYVKRILNDRKIGQKRIKEIIKRMKERVAMWLQHTDINEISIATVTWHVFKIVLFTLASHVHCSSK